jgi:hypothetical protein
MRYLQEQREWNDFIQEFVGVDVHLLNVSSFSSDCRVFMARESVFKARRLTPASMRGRTVSLEDEYFILNRLSSVKGVPRVRGYKRCYSWELLEMEALPPLPGFDPTFGQPRETASSFFDLIRVIIQINRLGCSHGDLHARNVGRNVEGGVSVLDFDQACVDRPWRCAMRDLLGLGVCEKRSEFSLFQRVRGVDGVVSVFKVLRVVRRTLALMLSKVRHLQKPKIPTYPQSQLKARAGFQEDESLELLADAWTLAASSNASAPRADIAYYSLDIAGINFPGERPWILRWDRIRKHVDFKGKKLLELGCNMSLLSIHALLEGASECVGVDVDSEIIRSAELAAKGFGVEMHHRQLDLDSPGNWESELHGFDIVSALSVIHWVKNQKRIWTFLGLHEEVLYEGHESDDAGEFELRKVGFTNIVRLGVTERNRHIFYASRKT